MVIRALLNASLSMALIAGCGGAVERTTGVISASARWSGAWPLEGQLMVALFTTPPWDPAYQPGPPAAFRLLARPDTDSIWFVFDRPQIAFGTYKSLAIAWGDPQDQDPATRDRPLSIYGTTLEQMERAEPIVLSREHPDALGLEMPALVLYQSAEEMRAHYPPVPR